MTKHRKWLLLACLSGMALFPAARLFCGDPQQDFDQAVADLQKNPDNLALRQRIISLSLELDALPASPPDVAILTAKAVYAAKGAVSPGDYQAAVDAYKQATLLAPWDGTLYYNQGVVEQEAGLPRDAARDFELYLAAQPAATDRGQVLARIGKLELQEDQQAGQVRDAWGGVIIGVGICGIVGGGTLLLVNSLGNPGGNYYTQAAGPNQYEGEAGYTLYGGDYYTNASYNSFISGQRQGMALGWGCLGAGVVLTAVGIVVVVSGPSAGPSAAGRLALFNYKDGQLALGVPPIDLMPRGGLRTALLHAEF